jgi:threonylcarbamoyladenosine tRNA methylthiotransferase MtaB
MSPTVSFKTLGCRLNQAESDAMAEDLDAHGYEEASGEASPDLVVVNTCTVTREATKASRSAIRRAVRAHPSAKVVVIGCYAVSDPEEVARIEGVDAVLTNNDKDRFFEAVRAQLPSVPLLQIGVRGAASAGPQNGSGAASAGLQEVVGAASAVPRDRRRAPRIRANLKVQTGCDEWCTFCIIPTTRGPLRSYPEEALVAEAAARARAGARELVLTGVHLGKYAYDRGGDERDLVRLLQRLLAVDGIARLRLSSILSRHLTDELVGFMASEPRVCRYLHVPLQAGDDGVLEAMHRPYRIDRYVESVQRAQAALPGLALATDVIVGFPGESERAFRSTLDVVEAVGFSKLHVFRYSARPGTPAASMAGEVPAEVKRERSKRLIDTGNALRGRFLHEHIGPPLRVLVEDERDVDGMSVCSGQTDDYVRVWFEGRNLLGALAAVRGTRVRADGIEGRLETR